MKAFTLMQLLPPQVRRDAKKCIDEIFGALPAHGYIHAGEDSSAYDAVKKETPLFQESGLFLTSLSFKGHTKKAKPTTSIRMSY